MIKYLLNRVLRGILSILAVTLLVMLMVYNFSDRNTIFQGDQLYTKKSGNERTEYKYSKWADYGYLEYYRYTDFVNSLVSSGEIDQEYANKAYYIGDTKNDDSDETAFCVSKFYEYYKSKGFNVSRLNAVGTAKKRISEPTLFAFRDVPILTRWGNYFKKIIWVDNIHNASGIPDEERKITFTLFDPAYGGNKFSPAIIGNGTTYKYLLYCDNQFPYIHANLMTLRLGTSYSVNTNVDIWVEMNNVIGVVDKETTIYYPTGYVDNDSINLHSARYSENSLVNGGVFTSTRYVDDYTNTSFLNKGRSRIGFSFVIGLISVVIAYVLGVSLGIVMARHKDGIIDKLGTLYIIFISAVPSLAYIFMFKAAGVKFFKLPDQFSASTGGWKMYALPIISLALPSVANLMKWLRRYMIDQMNSDYVKFARSGGLSESEIFTKHISKNALIPIVHGIPGSIIGALTGAIITERLYSVPGVGGVLIDAIKLYDNAVIIGVALFFATLSVISIILGDILMSMVDPRISFTDKAR